MYSPLGMQQAGLTSNFQAFYPGFTLFLAFLTSVKNLVYDNPIEANSSVLNCKYKDSKRMLIRSADLEAYLHIWNETLSVGPISDTRDACFNIHLFHLGSLGLYSEAMVFESSIMETFLTANSSFGPSLEGGYDSNIRSVNQTDGRFFILSKEEFNKYFTIKHLESGLFMSASSSSTSAVLGNMIVMLVNQPGASTEFELFPC